MTTRELSQLYYLRREINEYEKKLEELEGQMGISAVSMDGMPHAKGITKSQVEQLAVEIADLKAIIHAKQIERIHETNRLERFIQEIPDSLTRQIFELRFAQCLSWDRVADLCGSENTGESVRMRCYRYLKKDEIEEPVAECSAGL